MIEIIYRGRLGNNLFQYCFGRILAEQLGWRLKADPIPGFPNTAERIDGEDHSDLTPEPYIWQDEWQPIAADRNPRRIVVYGYFQKYSNFQPFKERIREEWLQTDIPLEYPIEENALVLHVRRGDYVKMGSALPFSFFDRLVRQIPHEKLIIFTDDTKDPFFRKFERYDPVIPDLSAEQTFRALMDAKKLVISQSSFSWWAAFLSQATEIHVPVPYLGYWSKRQYPDIDLNVSDETRFHYSECSPTLKDRLRVVRWKLREAKQWVAKTFEKEQQEEAADTS